MGQQIRILIIDDHALFRESLGRLLEAEPDFHVAGASASATRALPMIEREEIDLVLLDYDLGEEQGSLFLDHAKTIGYRGRVLIVTAGMNDADTLRVRPAHRRDS